MRWAAGVVSRLGREVLPVLLNRFSAVIVAAFMTWPAHSATFTYTNINDTDVGINLKGEIVEGDDANLQKTIEWVEANQHRKFFGLSLNSPGGSVSKIGQNSNARRGFHCHRRRWRRMLFCLLQYPSSRKEPICLSLFPHRRA